MWQIKWKLGLLVVTAFLCLFYLVDSGSAANFPRRSLALVVLARVTDTLDRNAARWYRRGSGDVRPSAGEWLDPLVDKIFVIIVLGAIQFHDPAPWGVVALIVARELVLVPLAGVYRFVVRGKARFKAGVLGKTATIAEFVAVGMLILRAQLVLPFAIAAAALGQAAIVEYILRVIHEAPAHEEPSRI